jgi:hypothetical protein
MFILSLVGVSFLCSNIVMKSSFLPPSPPPKLLERQAVRLLEPTRVFRKVQETLFLFLGRSCEFANPRITNPQKAKDDRTLKWLCSLIPSTSLNTIVRRWITTDAAKESLNNPRFVSESLLIPGWLKECFRCCSSGKEYGVMILHMCGSLEATCEKCHVPAAKNSLTHAATMWKQRCL